MMDKTKLLIARAEDLAEATLKKDYPSFSGFLDMKQQTTLKNFKVPGVTPVFFGGYEDAERKVLGFFPDWYEDYSAHFPVKAIEIIPSDTENLTHRDYLGSIMGLGIKRECIGDIIQKDDGAYVFAGDEIIDFLIGNLDKIGHRNVKVKIKDNPEIMPKSFKHISGTCASERIDCILCMVMNLSRGKAEELIKSGRVMINYTEASSVCVKLKSGDTVSVRGFGKFIFKGSFGVTKKGRIKAEIEIYN